jgi:hypothetical protein
VHFDRRLADLACLLHQNKWSGKYSLWSCGAWNHTGSKTDSFTLTFSLAFANSDTFTFTFFDVHTFADANAIAFTGSDVHEDGRWIMKDEAEHLVRMIVGNWRHSTAGCYSQDMEWGRTY